MSKIFKMGKDRDNRIIECIHEDDWFLGWHLWFKFLESNEQADNFFKSSLNKLAQ